MPVRFVPTPELRAAALPSAEGKLVLPSAKLLVAGKARTGAPALHDTLVKTLEARGKFATKMPSPTVAELQLVLATGRARVGPFAAALVGAYGLVAVVRALLSTPEATLVTERSGTPKAEWVVEGDAAPSDARALPIMVPEWLDTLRSAIEAASSETRAKLVGIVAAARTGLPIAARAALARAFRNAEWAEEDAPEVLAIANPYVRAGRGLSPVRMLLACATRAETFARLYEASVSEYLFTSGLHAEIAMFLEPEAALERLVKLFETPLEKESTAYVLEVVKVIACFEDERAADAIAAAAHVARDEVAAYFTVHPRLVPRLERLAKGRGRKVDAVRAILEIVARAHAGGVATESVVTELPRCIATPPWESRVEPWPARELALVVGNRERVVPTRGVAQAATAMERWASRRRPSSTALDAEILAKRGVIEPERYSSLPTKPRSQRPTGSRPTPSSTRLPDSAIARSRSSRKFSYPSR